MQGDDAALEAIRQRRMQELMAKHGYQVIHVVHVLKIALMLSHALGFTSCPLLECDPGT